GVVAGQEHRKHAALGLKLVESLQPAFQRFLLTGSAALKSCDIRLQGLDVRLRLADAAGQLDHKSALVGQTPVDDLEFREQSGFALASLGRLDLRLAEALLRLAEIALRVAQVAGPVAPLGERR